jgi:hypothetical protein
MTAMEGIAREEERQIPESALQMQRPLPGKKRGAKKTSNKTSPKK